MQLSESRIKKPRKNCTQSSDVAHYCSVVVLKKQGILLNNVVNFQAMIYLYCRVEIEFMAKTSLLQNYGLRPSVNDGSHTGLLVSKKWFPFYALRMTLLFLSFH